jgi:hypothetical protein
MRAANYWRAVEPLLKCVVDMNEDELREMVYTVHIVQMQERLLYRRKWNSQKPLENFIEYCEAGVSAMSSLGDIFYDAEAAERLNITKIEAETEEKNAKSTQHGPRIRPFLEMPGLQVARFSEVGSALGQASDIIPHIDDNLKRFAYSQTLVRLDEERFDRDARAADRMDATWIKMSLKYGVKSRIWICKDSALRC